MPTRPDAKSAPLTLQRFHDNKRQRGVLICLLLGALVFLIIGLQSISIQAPTPINFEQQNGNTDYVLRSLRDNRVFVFFAFVVVLLLLLLIASRINHKWGIMLLAGSILVAIVFYFAPAESVKETIKPLQPVSTPVVEQADVTTPQAIGQASTVEFHPPQFSNLFLLFISLTVVLFVAFIVWMIYIWQRSQQLPEMHIQSLEEIGEAARLALDELETGLDERDAVIHCYTRMNEIVMHSHHVERGAARTASEFAARLEVLGLPGQATRRLTRLFETVRYGAYASPSLAIEEAKECLAEIAKYCGEPV